MQPEMVSGKQKAWNPYVADCWGPGHSGRRDGGGGPGQRFPSQSVLPDQAAGEEMGCWGSHYRFPRLYHTQLSECSRSNKKSSSFANSKSKRVEK